MTARTLRRHLQRPRLDYARRNGPVACAPIAIALVLAVLAPGCGSHRPPPPRWQVHEPSHVMALPRGVELDSVVGRVSAERNVTALRAYELERALYRRSAGESRDFQRPALCLALSGGGLRSAAFSIGVLQGLQADRVLDNVDVISAVSGGGYALSWLYAQQYVASVDRQSVLALSSKPYTDLRSVPRFVNQNTAIAVFVLSAPKSLFDIGARTIANVHVPSNAQLYYEHRIRSTFHGARDIPWAEIRNLVGPDKNPLPILNVTGTVRDDGAAEGRSLLQIFEISPILYGSEFFGLHEQARRAFPGDFARAVAISGAGADEVYWERSWFPRMFRGGVGYTYDGFPWRDGAGIAHDNIYLTDGGFAENLGVYTLVKRLCASIFVVDAAYDPHLGFEEYWHLKQGLKRHMDAELTVPVIEANSGWATALNVPDVGLTCGTIGRFALPSAGGQLPNPDSQLRVSYLKLSWHPKWAALNVPEFDAVASYMRQCDSRSDPPGHCMFPHDATEVLDFTTEQFDAYVHLGRGMVKGLLVPETMLRPDVPSHRRPAPGCPATRP